MNTPLRVAIADQDDARRQRIRATLECLPNLEVITQSATSDVREWLHTNARPDICLVTLTHDSRSTLETISQVTMRDPLLPVLVIGDPRETDLVRSAMRAGAREFLSWPIDPCELASAISKAGMIRAGDSRTGRIIAVLPAHGGCGATMLSVNIAVSLARAAHGAGGRAGAGAASSGPASVAGPPEGIGGERPLAGHESSFGPTTSGGRGDDWTTRARSASHAAIVDLVHNWGTVGVYLDVQPACGVTDICHGPEHIDLTTLRAALVHHRSGVEVLAQSTSYTPYDPPSPDQVRSILVMLRAMFSYTIVDLPRSLDPATMEAVRLADQTLLVFGSSVAGVANARKMLQGLKQASLDHRRVKAVANRLHGGDELGQRRIEAALEHGSVTLLPTDARFAHQSAEAGRALVLEAPRSPLSRSIRELAHSLNGRLGAEPARGRGLLRRLIQGG